MSKWFMMPGWWHRFDNGGEPQQLIQLYPNPVTNTLTIQLTQQIPLPVTYTIANTTGKTIETGALINPITQLIRVIMHPEFTYSA
ncbi:MAG: hypothetical protein H6546_08465 [Chitinophagales bacterium]|nr:hypothetical protein [Chitinophagales bacterium]